MRNRWPRAFWRAGALALVALVLGCQSSRPIVPVTQPATVPAVAGLNPPMANRAVDAWCAPPVGWKLDQTKADFRHTHQIWKSPSGSTAYGVIEMYLPLPVGPDWVLSGFIDNMRKKEGSAELLSKQADPTLPGTRFVAEGGLYKIRVNLIVQGWRAWAVYAGSLRDKAINQQELMLAEAARDHTHVVLPDVLPAPALRATANSANP